jgi:hypothetical protein
MKKKSAKKSQKRPKRPQMELIETEIKTNWIGF